MCFPVRIIPPWLSTPMYHLWINNMPHFTHVASLHRHEQHEQTPCIVRWLLGNKKCLNPTNDSTVYVFGLECAVVSHSETFGKVLSCY
jgi:hypothetical protein